jgi:rfaE bifunctional protein nucleotidyltransferase chain/domain
MLLIVGLNSDASVRRLKGPERPVRTEAERAYVLAALRCVDVVTVFDEDTPLELVRAILPDVIVKGGDYTEDTVVGAREVRARGGDVVIVPLTPGQSTTSIIEKLRAQRHSPRRDRAASALRPVSLERGAVRSAEGSCLVAFGNTRVLCAVSGRGFRPRMAEGERAGVDDR